MNKLLITLVLLALSSGGLRAQLPGRGHPFVRSSGEASVFVAPDQVKVDASVTTQGTTAQDASARNAGVVASVLAALGKLLGPSADIKTINYSVVPNYIYPSGGGTPTLTGYTANNTVEVTVNGVSMAGPVIDTATQAGATSVSGLRFALRDPEPTRLQALRQATLHAKSHADAMANGLGGTVGAVVSLQEGTAIRVQPLTGTGGAPSTTTTPVVPGLIEVQASVVLEVELN